MTKTALSVAAAALLASMAPAFAAKDCAGGYEAFMMNISSIIPKGKIPGADLASAMKKGLDAYNSCVADDAAPRDVWLQIEKDLHAKAER